MNKEQIDVIINYSDFKEVEELIVQLGFSGNLKNDEEVCKFIMEKIEER